MNNVVFVCQSIDNSDRLLQSTEVWIKALNDDRNINVCACIAIRVGENTLPSSVLTYKLSKFSCKAIRALYFLWIIIGLRLKYKKLSVFIYQGGPYSYLLLAINLLNFKVKIYQWKAHPKVSFFLKLSVKFVNTLTFTSTKHSLPINSKRVVIVGQGVPLSNFKYDYNEATRDIVTIGRLSVSKDIVQVIKILKLINHKSSLKYNLHIYGDAQSSADDIYKNHLLRIINDYDLQDCVHFNNSISWSEVLAVLSTSKLFISCSKTALDRSVAEALVCGLPVLTCNENVYEYLTDNHKKLMIFERDAYSDAADKALNFLECSKVERKMFGKEISELYSKIFDLTNVVKRISVHMKYD